jgi:hypothetical protein
MVMILINKPFWSCDCRHMMGIKFKDVTCGCKSKVMLKDLSKIDRSKGIPECYVRFEMNKS